MEPRINILIRCGDRPNLFKRCLESVLNQTYKNVRKIVSIDRHMDGAFVDYVEQHSDLIWRIVPDKSKPYYYNLYCNTLKAEVTEGWFFYLDDDDYLDNPHVLENIAKELTDPETAIICQFRRNGKPKPADSQMDAGIIRKGYIGLPCLFLHHSNKNIADIKGYVDYDDYNFIKEISEKMPVKFVKHVVVCTDRRSHGKPEITKQENETE